MIKNLLFDMGGIVFVQDTAEAVRRFREAGLDTDYYLGHYGQRDFFLELESGAITTEEFCQKMAQATGRQSISYAQAQHCWLGFIKEVPTARLRALLPLKERFRTGLLSNTNPFIMAFTDSPDFSADRLPISHYFHQLFLSYEMGICKPRADIFLRALEQGGMKADETLFIDDSPSNIEAASALGIHTLHVPTNSPWEHLMP